LRLIHGKILRLIHGKILRLIHGKILRLWIMMRRRKILRLYDVHIFPRQVVFFQGFDDAVAQAFGVVARHHELDGGKKRLDEGLFLVVEVLADVLAHRDDGAFKLQDAQAMRLWLWSPAVLSSSYRARSMSAPA